MTFIEFNFNSKHLIYPFLLPIVYVSRQFCLAQLKIFDKNYLLFVLLMFISESSCGIVEIIKHFWCNIISNNLSSKSKPILKNKPHVLIRKENLGISNKILFKEFLFIFLISIIDLSFNLFLSLNNQKNKGYVYLNTFLRIIQIIFLSFLSYFILHLPIHRFHTICFGIIVILLTILLIEEKLTNFKSELISDYLLQITKFIIAYSINSFQYVLHKHLMDSYFYSPYAVLGITGSLGLVLTYALMLFGSLLHIESISFNSALTGWSEMSSNMSSFPYLILVYICGVLVNVFVVLINFFLTPPFNGIGDTFNGICTAILMFILDDSKMPIYAIIILVFSFITCLIYSEIIVFNCLSFEKNTKKEIGKRGQRESQGMQSLISIEIPNSDNNALVSIEIPNNDNNDNNDNNNEAQE